MGDLNIENRLILKNETKIGLPAVAYICHFR
jgi:hypothetical protein